MGLSEAARTCDFHSGVVHIKTSGGAVTIGYALLCWLNL